MFKQIKRMNMTYAKDEFGVWGILDVYSCLFKCVCCTCYRNHFNHLFKTRLKTGRSQNEKQVHGRNIYKKEDM